MPGTAVIVPYFQREPGKLAAAIRSALAQEDSEPVTVVVCDDESPIPAEDELATLSEEQRQHVILLRQKNAGPGAARNTALDNVPAGIEWIAFLDSDDLWRPDHIARAVEALRQGHDLCFADALREPEQTTHFHNAAFDPARHRPIGSLPDLYALSEDFLTLNLRMSPVSISTVVMRASTLGDLRFARMAFEDLMFWFEAARRNIRVAFDSTLQVNYSRGNITLTDHWISQASLRNTLSYHRIFLRVAREFSLTAEQNAILRQRMAENRQLFGKITLGLLWHGKQPSWRVVLDFIASDPRAAGRLLASTASEIASRPPFARASASSMK